MSDFFSHLIARTLEPHWGVQPRLPSRFESEVPLGTVHSPLPVTEVEEIIDNPSFPSSKNTPETETEVPEGFAVEERAKAINRLPQVLGSSHLGQRISSQIPQSAPSANRTIRSPSATSPQNSAVTNSQMPSQRIPIDSLDRGLNRDGVLTAPDQASSSSQTFLANSPSSVSESLPSTRTSSREEGRQPPMDKGMQRTGLEDGQVMPSHSSLPHPVEQRPSLKASDSTEASAPQVIKVTIGRIDVRPNRTTSQAPTTPRSPHQQGLSLEDYLRQHPGGRS